MPRHRSAETKSPPRIMIEVTPEQFDTFKKFLPYGFQRQVFKAVIQDMVAMWQIYGEDFTRALLAKNLTYQQFMDDYSKRTYGYRKDEDGNSSEPQKSSFPGNELGTTIRVYEGDKSIKEEESKG